MTDDAQQPQPAADPTEADQADPDTFSREYVQQLRKEAADHRAKSRKVTEANARLMTLQAGIDGRLVDVDALTFAEDMLDDSGLVDPARVTAAIDALIESKPYLRKAAPPIAQGVMPQAPAEPGLFDLIRQRL
jgi:hypothetical protein